MTHKPPPVQATLQINGGPPITVEVDEVRLIEWQPVRYPDYPLQLRMEFQWTQEFADWWRTLTSQAAGAQVEAANPFGGEQR